VIVTTCERCREEAGVRTRQEDQLVVVDVKRGEIVQLAKLVYSTKNEE